MQLAQVAAPVSGTAPPASGSRQAEGDSPPIDLGDLTVQNR
jgi:hypothetical protein